jgi:hypothetical protein
MKRILCAALVLMSILPATAAHAGYYTFYEKVNQHFLDDLNKYTLKAQKIVMYGKDVTYYPGRTGKDVTFIGRGQLEDIAGIKVFPASFVVVGHPQPGCPSCLPQITRYHVDSRGEMYDNLIAVYQ